MQTVDVTGFGNDEEGIMKDIRLGIEKLFHDHLNFKDVDTIMVNFSVDPSIESSLEVPAIARIYTHQFIIMTDNERDVICHLVYSILERLGKHRYNMAFTPGYKSMQGRLNPDYNAKLSPSLKKLDS